MHAALFYRAISVCWMICLDYYLFKLIAGRASGLLGKLSLLLMRERVVHCTVNSSLSQQKRSVLIERQVRQELFSALCQLVLTSVIVKSIKNSNPALHLDGMMHQMKKEKTHCKMCKKLACSPRSYF